MTKNYKEFQDEVQSEQKDLKYAEVKEKMEQSSDFMVELDNLPNVKHLWIDRGAKMTCEHAGHDMHEAWKRK
jgi:hypothetical protein